MFATLDRILESVTRVAEDKATLVGGMSIHAWAFLVLISFAALMPGLASVPAMDRDEARYSQASRQMLETGDFVDIRFQDVPRHVKPAGTYWLQAISVSLSGGPEHAEIWAYRLPSFLGALASVLLTAWIGARIGGGRVGLLAGSLLAVSLILSVEARTAKTDALLLASVLAAQAALWRILERMDRGEDTGRFVGAPLLFWVAHGAGVMIKGPIITLVLAGTVIALCVWRRDLEVVKRLKLMLGVPVTLAVIAPWVIGISMKVGGAFIEESVGHSLMGKVARSDDAHGAPPGYHTLVFLLAFWPGAMLAAMAVAEGWRSRAEPAVRFLICWILPTLIVFEIVVTKLPHYTLPMYPAMAILAALAVVRGADLVSSGRWKLAHRVVSVLFLAVTAILAFVPLVAILVLEGVISFSATLALFFGALILWAGKRFLDGPTPARVLGVTVMVVPFLIATFAFTAPQLDTLWVTRDLKPMIARAAPCERPAVAVAGFAEPSLVFVLGTETKLAEPGEAADLLHSNACAVVVVDDREMERFTQALDGLALKRHGSIQGLNYSKGRDQNLTVYTRAD
jgi:4-amino-4-deoxy-L-arabinose transferase-like glycosyltransferase